MRYPPDWRLMSLEAKKKWLAGVKEIRREFENHIDSGEPLKLDKIKIDESKDVSGDLKFFKNMEKKIEENNA